MYGQKKTAYLYPLRVSEAFAYRARAAVQKYKQLGYNHADLRRQLWQDFINMMEEGELPDIPGRIVRKNWPQGR